MSIQAHLEQLAELVESADFRAKQDAFYARHCHELYDMMSRIMPVLFPCC